MSKKLMVRLVMSVILTAISGVAPLLMGQEPDLSDPVKVANDVLRFIQTDDADGMLAVMDPDQKSAYLPFTPDKRQEMLRMIEKDKEKIGKVKQISEIRACTTFTGKPGIAAKVRKKSDELYVVILSQQDNLYYYDNLLTLTPDAYNKLKLIKEL